MPSAITIACEGYVDALVLRRLLADRQLDVAAVHEAGGKHKLDAKLGGYISAARFGPWLVQRDLDLDAACAPELVRDLVPDAPAGLCLIVPVRQTEAWLLADRHAIAEYLRVAEGRVPGPPEALEDAKAALVALARASRRKDVREDMVPRPASGRRVGVGYTHHMQAFIQRMWRPAHAALVAPSLAKLMRRLDQFQTTGAWH